MRNKQKEKILGIVKTLHEAHEAIRNAVRKKNVQEARALLAECQQAAIGVGTHIEKSEGEGHEAVSCLEEYCEVLFDVYEKLEEDTYGEEGTYKLLYNQLTEVENTIKNSICIKKEVAFFPYKASMWDSLESIYLSMKADPECDVYCVPIPYFDLNPDRSLGAMHYEGGEYPEGIEITDWKDYDLEERIPDEIYIHNGYDDWNLVTSVHPRFYARNLKRYTDKLVYVPYFVQAEIEPYDQAEINGMKHFIWIPGVIFADRVIVQSEKMKQIYVNEYLKAAKENGLRGKHLNRMYVEQKISGAGSPKLDRIKRIQTESLNIPKEWRGLIQKADGTDKKVVFYNTSINALLEYDDQMLRKMERVFEIFKKYREEVVLLWRPHPLIASTIQSMRPYLWTEYSRIVENYKKEDWGIYDDSADIDRAVVLSDAYYGDMSSVVELCHETGIPVMIQNVDV